MPALVDLKDEYARLWKSMALRDDKKSIVEEMAKKIASGQARYKEVSDKTNVPWYVVGIIHSLESGCRFETHLHNGDSLDARTHRKPPGRPPTGEAPFKWADSATDALRLKEFDKIKEWSLEQIALALETYNGFGYRNRNLGNSPYLWSCTNHYTKGKFKSDGEFDPDLESDQAGGMALLAHLETFSLPTTQSLSPAVRANILIPANTGFFRTKKLPELRPAADSPPAAEPDRMKENERVQKLGENPPLWHVQVFSRTGRPRAKGFVEATALTPEQALAPEVDPARFAQLCLDAARLRKTSAHHLVALADAETSIRNMAAKSGDGVGPFLISAADWDAMIAGGDTQLQPTQRLDPLQQPLGAATIAARTAAALQPVLPDSRLPTSAELYLAHLVSTDKAKTLLGDRTQPLAGTIDPQKAQEIAEVRPWLLEGAPDVATALDRMARRMDYGYERAIALFDQLEPGQGGGPATVGFAARLRDKCLDEWTFFGRQAYDASGEKVRKGHIETDARVPPDVGEDWFARVGRYWLEGAGRSGLNGKNTGEPWSAAFISWVVKAAGAGSSFRGSAQHSQYISKAIRDFRLQAKAAYWCKRLSEHKPQVGDIVCWTRQSGIDYDRQNGGDYKGHCDVVVEALGGTTIDVIGGNIGHSVSRRTLALDGNGHLRPVTIHGETLFAVMVNKLP